MQQIRARMRKYHDLRIAVRNLQTFNIGGGNFDLDFIIRGPELEALADYTDRLRQQANELGLQDADTTLKLNKPELRVQIDRARAADLGIRTQEVAAALRLLVGGDQEVSRFRDPTVGEDYDVQLRLVDEDRRDPDTIARLYVARNTGEMVRLDSVVTLEEGRSPSRVDRYDRQRQANLRSGIAPGYALADRLEAVRAAAARLGMPAAYSTAISGRGRELERTFAEFGWAFLLSVIFMYMVLAAQYQSLINPLVILLALPLSLPFALLSIYLTGNTLNLYSALGMLVLFGVVAKNAILQIDHTLNLRRQGRPREQAILDANRDRLRPILMTTLALVGGMLPLAIGSGPGAEERRTIAVVVIGGQTLSLFLTLVVVPVAYSLVDDAVLWVIVAAPVRRRARSRSPRPRLTITGPPPTRLARAGTRLPAPFTRCRLFPPQVGEAPCARAHQWPTFRARWPVERGFGHSRKPAAHHRLLPLIEHPPRLEATIVQRVQHRLQRATHRVSPSGRSGGRSRGACCRSARRRSARRSAAAAGAARRRPRAARAVTAATSNTSSRRAMVKPPAAIATTAAATNKPARPGATR